MHIGDMGDAFQYSETLHFINLLIGRKWSFPMQLWGRLLFLVVSLLMTNIGMVLNIVFHQMMKSNIQKHR
jgi:hypothetical protein